MLLALALTNAPSKLSQANSWRDTGISVHFVGSTLAVHLGLENLIWGHHLWNLRPSLSRPLTNIYNVFLCTYILEVDHQTFHNNQFENCNVAEITRVNHWDACGQTETSLTAVFHCGAVDVDVICWGECTLTTSRLWSHVKPTKPIDAVPLCSLHHLPHLILITLFGLFARGVVSTWLCANDPNNKPFWANELIELFLETSTGIFKTRLR